MVSTVADLTKWAQYLYVLLFIMSEMFNQRTIYFKNFSTLKFSLK